MRITIVQPPDAGEYYLQDAFNLLKRACKRTLSLNLSSALKAVGPATSTNTPEEAGSLIEQMAELGILEIDYSA